MTKPRKWNRWNERCLQSWVIPTPTPATNTDTSTCNDKGFRVIAMSEDRSSNGQKSWLGKLTQAFAHEPKNRQELLELLRDAHQNKLLDRSEEHTSELQSLMRISYAVFCLKKKIKYTNTS